MTPRSKHHRTPFATWSAGPAVVKVMAVVAVLAVSVVSAATVWGQPQAAAPAVRIERTDGTVVTGTLESIDAREVRVAALPAIPVAGVRRVIVTAAGDRDPPRPVTVVGAGLRLTGDDFLWQERRAVIVRAGGRIELPIELVRLVAFHAQGAADAEPAWLGAIPEKPASDFVVIGRQKDKDGAGFELVECAITGVDAEQVAVVLDEAPIRVNRGKVVGLHWLRPAAAAAEGALVEVLGGSLRCRSVTWTPAAVEIDGTVKLPGHLLRTIDYAAGRQVRLATLTAEQTTVEPFFGGLTAVEGVGEFFAPRFLPATHVNAGSLVVRPRTVVVWRMPADSRRFRTRLVTSVGGAGRTAAVTIRVDDREVFQGPAAGGPAPAGASSPADTPIDVDVASGRRLTITVESAASGPVGPVLFHDPVFEK